MKDRKNTKTANGKKIGRPRTLTDAERKAKAEAKVARLTEWRRKKMRDPKYRAEMKRRAEERKRRLEADAQLGRIAREWMARFTELMSAFAVASEIFGKDDSKRTTASAQQQAHDSKRTTARKGGK